MERKRRRTTEHQCQMCPFHYRSQGSCYRHMVKAHGMYYMPGRNPQPVPPEELRRLLRMFAQSNLNGRQRRRLAERSSTVASANVVDQPLYSMQNYYLDFDLDEHNFCEMRRLTENYDVFSEPPPVRIWTSIWTKMTSMNIVSITAR